MQRRDFLKTAALGAAATAVPGPALTLPRPAPVLHRPVPSSTPATGTALLTDARYLDHVLIRSNGTRPPEVPERLVRMRAELEARGLIAATVPLSPQADPLDRIRAHHTGEHVDSVRQLGVTSRVAELAVSGALTAVDAVADGTVRNAFCAIRPPGHHANNTGAEEGFCYYSNAAIAARYAQDVHGYERVVIIDWDYHHGNATQNAFYADPTVLFFSAHDWNAYPGTGDPSLTGEGDATGLNINAHLDCGATDADMLRHWDTALSPAVAAFNPDFVLVSAGFDSRRDDLLGCFALTDDAFRQMTRIAMDYADSCCEGRLVSLLEGGYNLDGTALAAATHVETLLG
ncbi:MAG: histone deacetylase [Gemmatimonadetes bacterium]|nr:histone deacetylase [Gemmatimonadota bacterium]MYG21905.1 histone deacetylase [Gemmatimonadota bacterium]MYJ38946.1 histone deacetylase [Gemmatimonadota bacterium]